MKSIRLLILAIILFSLHLIVNGQVFKTHSNDGLYYAEIYPVKESLYTPNKIIDLFQRSEPEKSMKYIVEVFNMQSQEMLHEYKLDFKNYVTIKSFEMSLDGKGLYIKAGNYTLIYNLRSGKLIKKFLTPETERQVDESNSNADEIFAIHKSGYKQVCFPNYDYYFIVRSDTELQVFDIFSGNYLYSYTGFSRYANFKQLYFTKDDKFLVGIDDSERFYIWEAENPKVKKRLSGEAIHYNSKESVFYLIKEFSSSYNLYKYSASDFNQLERMSSSSVFRDFLRLNEFEPNKFSNEAFSSGRYPAKLEVLNFKLDPTQKYVLITSEKDKISNINLIINIKTENILYVFESKAFDDRELMPFWISENRVILPEGNQRYQVYNFLRDQRINFTLGNEMEELLGTGQEKKNTQKYVSSDLKYTGLTWSDDINSQFVIVQNYPEKLIYPADNYMFESFVTSNRFIIQDTTNIHSLINAEFLFEERGQINNYLVNFKEAKGTTSEAIIDDSKAPAGYEYFRLTNIKPLNNQDSLNTYHLIERSVQVNDDLVNLDLHIVDQNGNYYTGAAADSMRNLWCGVYLSDDQGEIIEVDNFKLKEQTVSKPSKYAISVVLDHSGSMGEERIYNLQVGTLNLIKNKRQDDGLAIVKYDHFIGVESQISTQKRNLESRLKVEGTGEYGGGTALLDGINAGISLIKNKRDFDEKIVVVFTDGVENSSLVSQENILLRALENDVKVYTIGFGDNVDDKYLQFISRYTGGNYYRLYDKEDLVWIFNDIYNKINNYYTVQLKTPIKGKQKIIVKLCLNGDNTLVTSFDNSPIEFNDDFLLEEIASTIDLNSMTHDIDYTSSEFEFLMDQIYIDEKDIKNNYFKIPVTRHSTLKTEFSQLTFPDIKFVFDKTEIIEGTADGLDEVVSFMKAHEESIISIIGHTDSLGTDYYNKLLSVNRANKIKSLMVDNGVEPNRIRIAGVGDKQPISENRDSKGRLQNRRVEFRLIYP